MVKTPGLIWGYNKTSSFGAMRFDTTAADPLVRFEVYTIDCRRVLEQTLRRSHSPTRPVRSRLPAVFADGGVIDPPAPAKDLGVCQTVTFAYHGRLARPCRSTATHGCKQVWERQSIEERSALPADLGFNPA